MIQMATREARRAEALQVDIRKLKEARVRLQRKRKQAEAKHRYRHRSACCTCCSALSHSARHRMWLETKEREIKALRRAGRKRERQVSALQIEARRQHQWLRLFGKLRHACQRLGNAVFAIFIAVKSVVTGH